MILSKILKDKIEKGECWVIVSSVLSGYGVTRAKGYIKENKIYFSTSMFEFTICNIDDYGKKWSDNKSDIWR